MFIPTNVLAAIIISGILSTVLGIIGEKQLKEGLKTGAKLFITAWVVSLVIIGIIHLALYQ